MSFSFEEVLKQVSSAYVLTEEVFREELTLTDFAFSRLLEWLDDGVESHGERYLEIRRRLVSYFERRNRLFADELADETLNRIGRKLEQSIVIETRPPARYCYVVARFVMLEDVRRERKHVHFDEPSFPQTSWAGSVRTTHPEETRAIREKRLDCLDHCLLELRPDQRELIIDYYRNTRRQKIEYRREMAARLGITMNALGIRVCRLRDALRACVERCRNRRRI